MARWLYATRFSPAYSFRSWVRHRRWRPELYSLVLRFDSAGEWKSNRCQSKIDSPTLPDCNTGESKYAPISVEIRSKFSRDFVGIDPLRFTDLLGYIFTIDNDTSTKISSKKMTMRMSHTFFVTQNNITLFKYEFVF